MIVKHANPCGVSSRKKLIDAYEKAFETDKTSAFGGVIAFNKEVDENLARKILENQFVEIIISPSFSKESLEIFKSKKDIRVIEYKDYKDINESKNVQIMHKLSTVFMSMIKSDDDIELTEEEYGIRIVKTVSQENYNNEIWDQWVLFSRRIYDNISKILKGK